MSAPTTAMAPAAPDRLMKARDDLAKATTAAKLAAAKRAKLAAEVRALEAEAELEGYRLQEQADRQRADTAEARADAAESALAAERAAHLAEEREHAAEVERFKPRAPAAKRTNGRKDTDANGHAITAEPGRSAAAAATLAVVPDTDAPG